MFCFESTMPEIIGLSKSISGFDPRSIGGCVTWLDGKDPTTIFSDQAGTTPATVSGPARYWKDKSGQGNHFSNKSASTSYYPTYQSTNSIYIANTGGSGAPYYTASTYVCMQSINAYFTFPYYSIFAVISTAGVTSTPGLQTIFQVSRSSSSESRSPQWGVGGSFAIGSSNYASWTFSTSRWSSGDYNGSSQNEHPAANTVTVMGHTSGALSNVTYVSGVGGSSATGVSYVPWTTGAVAPYIGGGATDNRWMTGYFYEVLVYNSELTTAQRQEVEGYLSWKWGVQSALQTTHPFKSIAPLSRYFNPVDIPGCALWLDGADKSTITGGITSINDKANGVTFSTTGSVKATTLGSNGSLSFLGSGYLSGSVNSLLVGTSFVVFKATAANNGYYPFFTWSDSGLTLPAFGYVPGGSTIAPYTTNSGAGTPSNTATIGNTYLASYSWSGTTTAVGINGATPTSGTQGAYSSTSTVMLIGYDSGYYTTVNIGEIILYNSILTTSQRQQVEGYLASKWGLTLPSSNTLYAIPPSAVAQFTPPNIYGCALWLDAADTAATGTGTTLTTWTDKSGYGANATANTAISIISNAINGCSVLNFTNTQWLSGNINIVGTTFTIFSVFNMNSNSAFAARIIALGVSGLNDYSSSVYVGILRQSSSNMGPYRNGVYTSSVVPYSTNVIHTTYLDGVNQYVYTNGGTVSSNASTGNFAVSNYEIAANTNTGDAGGPFYGYIGEVIVYNTVLGSQQRQQVEGYLSSKWGIALPSNHPYYKFSPSHEIAGTGYITPSNISGLIVWNRADNLAVGNGSAVGTWSNYGNASGPTITCSGTQSNAVLNGLSVVNFTTSQSWTATSGSLTLSSYTLIYVSRQTPSTYGRVLQSATGNQIHGYWAVNNQVWYTEGWLVSSGPPADA